MKPLQCHGGKSEDIAYQILTLCHEMLEAMGMVDALGVQFVALQLLGHAKEWWRTFVMSRPIGSPSVEWNVFSIAFEDHFIPLECERGESSKLSVACYDY